MSKAVNESTEKIKLVLIYLTFGTVGLVAHFIPLSSSVIVFYRALLGGIFIIFMSLLQGKTIDVKSIKDNFVVLIFTGFFMGLNWVLQFEAFRVSSVAIGTVCYNTMPIFLVIIASFIFNEKIDIKTSICIIIATIGVVLVSNVINTGIKSDEVLGCVYGVLGAIFYALILIFNRKLSNIAMHDKIIFQFSFSAVVMLLYASFIEKSSFVFDKNLSQDEIIIGVICILLLSCLHTGFCYVQYFTAVANLKAKTVAILTYIDPVVAMLLSFFVLKESMTKLQFLGAVLILSSTLINEMIKIDSDLNEDNTIKNKILKIFKKKL